VPRAAREEVERFLQRRPPLYRAARAARLWAGRHLLRPRVIAGVPGRVHPNDVVMAWGKPHMVSAYLHAGRQARALVSDALASTGRAPADVAACLDFGCGYGRVLRHMVQELDPTRVWVSDVDRAAVSFCVSEFGVRPFSASEDDLETFELIYAISVLTHLAADDGRRVLDLFARRLRPGGAVMFTTHGRASLARIDSYGAWCGPQADAIQREVGGAGFSYRPYPHHKSDAYGLAWHDPSYVEAEMAGIAGVSMQLVEHWAGALEDHQDVFVFRRTT